MLAVASGDGVSSGDVEEGEEAFDELGEPMMSGEVGEGKPKLPGLPRLPVSEDLTLAGRPCWKRQRVPYMQNPNELKVRHRAPRGVHTLGLGLLMVTLFSFPSRESTHLETLRSLPPSMCKKLQRVPKGQTPIDWKVRQGMFLRRWCWCWAGRCSVGLWTNRQRLP